MIAIPLELEQPFIEMAKLEHKAPTAYLAELIAEWLEDYQDARLAEQAIKRLESGEDSLTDWEVVKARLYDVES
jgi:predicted DNA-binding protein